LAVAIRDAAPERGGADEEFILALNAACVPAVAEMDAQDYRDIAGWAHRVLIAETDGRQCGFLILVRPGSVYPSDNYAWFEKTFDNHLYIDRIAVSDAARGRGVGRAFYGEAVRIAEKNGDKRLTCEVNEKPPNPESMAFHRRIGFRHLHTRPSRDDKIVAMLELPLEKS
jgi:uncharacterized protein